MPLWGRTPGVSFPSPLAWARLCRDQLRQQAHQLAAAPGLEVEYLPRKTFRFIHPQLGLCFARLSSWCPFRLYDKLGLALRIETTVNDVNFFYHYREVEQRDGRRVWKRAEMKKGLYNLPLLRERFEQANQRYLEFVSPGG